MGRDAAVAALRLDRLLLTDSQTSGENRMNWKRIREIVRKEVTQSFREPRMRALLFIPPIVQFLVFGFVVNLDVERSRLAWFDQDNSLASRELRAAFEASKRFTVTQTPAN